MLKHRIEHVRLDSGLEGLIIDTPKTGVVVAEIGFRAGEFMMPQAKWETPHLMEHCLLGANRDYRKARDFQAAIEQNGAYSNASTSVYDVTYEVETADFEWERVVGLLCDGLSTPKFLQEEFDTEKSNVREELIYRGNNHFRHLNLGLKQAMGLQSLTDPERIELLDGNTRQDLINHYKKTHTLPNARFIIAGHFAGKYEPVIALLESRLRLPKTGKRIALPDEQPMMPDEPFVVRKPSVPNVYLYLDMYANERMSYTHRSAMQLVSTLLTETMYSRIFGAARERGLVYGMGSGLSGIGGRNGWWVGAQVSKTNSKPLMRLLRDECMRLREGIIDQHDFEAARKNMLGKLMRGGQTASGLVSSYSAYYAYEEVHDLNKYTREIESLAAQDCIDAFRLLCDANIWGVGVLGSTSKVPAGVLRGYAAEIFA